MSGRITSQLTGLRLLIKYSFNVILIVKDYHHSTIYMPLHLSDGLMISDKSFRGVLRALFSSMVVFRKGCLCRERRLA